MSDKKAPVYNNKTVFDICGHKLRIMSIENHPFGFVYRLSCKPHCCTHPNGIEMKIGESHLAELIQNRIAEIKFIGTVYDRMYQFYKKAIVQIHKG